MSLETILSKLAGTTGLDEGGKDQLYKLIDFGFVWRKLTADSMAADATSAVKIWTNPFTHSVQLIGFKVNADAAVTGHASNHATITLAVDNAADGAPATAASYTTDSDEATQGSLVADTSKAGALTVANCTVLPGANVFFAIAKGGSGVVIPASDFTLLFRKAG